jgi:hypothetical protein
VIREIVKGAHALDHWLKLRVGRIYTGLLVIGLVGGIIASVNGLSQAVHSERGLAATAGIVVFQLALLINQLAQFHEYREAVRIRRESRRLARAKDTSPQPPP